MPVTSTSVATKGAEEAAGSSFIFFKNKGNIDPTKLPQSTMPSIDIETVLAISNQ